MTNAGRRWDDDTVGVGVRDASEARPAVEALLAAMSRRGWVAEDPEAHLLPHLREHAARAGIEISAVAVDDGVLELTVAIPDQSPGAVRYAVVALVAAIAEASTHVRELPDRTFEVVTGMLPGDGSFAPHGHLLRVRAE